MNRLARVFSFNGRSTRLAFWRTTLCLIVAMAVVEAVVVSGTLISPVAGAITAVLFAPVMIANLAVAVRRLHDRGKGAWWLLVFGVAPFALICIARGLAGDPTESTRLIHALIALALMLASLVFSIWGWVELGFLRGQLKSNRFGAPIRA